MQQLYLIIAATLAFDAFLLGFLAWAFHAPRFASRRISDAVSLRVSRANRLRTMAISSAVSLATILGVLITLHPYLVTTAPTAWWVIALQATGILVIYDFVYYFLHRFMHASWSMRYVHGVHHRAKNPSALESFYLHPAELLAGLTLLMASTWVIGPVHTWAFAGAFFVYSTLNILIHSGIYFRRALLWPVDALTRKHHVHHMVDHGKNYSSLTPLPDLVFGTAG